MRLTPLKKRAIALGSFGLAALVGWSGLASAAGPPSSSQLRKIGSSSSAAKQQPLTGLGATPFTTPLIVVAFANHKAVVIGGSAVNVAGKLARVTNVPISATSCNVNFTSKVTSLSSHSVNIRWFGGIGCNRKVEMFGQAFLAQSATNYSGTGNFYKGVQSGASSGQNGSVVNSAHPSLYVWHATNIYFQENPSRGVIAISPTPGQQVNAATSCKVVQSASFGFGVHCDLYSQRF